MYEILRSKEDALEVAQETFLAFFQTYLKKPISKETQRQWLYLVAKNKALNVLRHSKYASQTPPAEKREEPTPEQITIERQTSEQIKTQVAHVMGLLSEREAMLIRLHMHELSYSEIAEVMGLSSASISKTLRRAKAAFRRIYENEYNRSTL